MIIDSSKIGMESARRYTSVNYRATTYTAGRRGSTNSNNLFDNLLFTDQDPSSNDSLKKEKLNKEKEGSAPNDNKVENVFSPNHVWESMRNHKAVSSVSPRQQAVTIHQIRQQCIMFILRFLAGFRNAKSANDTIPETEEPQNDAFSLLFQDRLQPSSFNQLTNQEYFYESEETSFCAAGQVVTADGRSIDFQMDIQMSREFSSYYEETSLLQKVSFLDPLVINLDTDIASVSDQKFYFDLDADGTVEEISQLGAGSGYLALDLNDNGIIDNGKELFGTASGDGFRDLARYDEDGNGWIDENDSIFNKLKIWTMDEDGKSELYTLKDKGLGALCLGHVSTNYMENNPLTNQTNAAIRSTGIFLYESGMVGSMQQLDLAQ